MKKGIEEIDKNFKGENTELSGTKFRSCFSEPFTLHGFYKPCEEKRFMRLPENLKNGKAVIKRLDHLIYNTAGGRVRFRTNSDYIAIKAELDEPQSVPHIAATGAMGFDIFTKSDGGFALPSYSGCFVPHLKKDGNSFDGTHMFDTGNAVMRDITINFPLYCSVSSLDIGVSEDARLEAPKPYTIEKPVVFYGSSITQGACSSRPGNCYNAILSRELDFDYINLGFSGNAYGDRAIAEYISGISMSAFVLDYDYNARSEEELSLTHHEFYRIIRSKNPELPIIMMSAPVAAPTKLRLPNKRMDASRVIIMESFIQGIKEGDKNLYFIDGESLLGDKDAKDALVDSVHPNDIGFRNMADRIYPVLKSILYSI